MSDKSNKYGYVGVDIPEQSFGNNKGIFNPAEINELVADNKWTQFGQLELIETQTVSEVASLDFNTLGDYNVHFLTYNNVYTPNGSYKVGFRFYESGVLETGNVYQYAQASVETSVGAYAESKSTSDNYIRLISTGTQFFWANGYAYFYNLQDSSKYSFLTMHNYKKRNSDITIAEFGSGVMTQASTVDGINIFRDSGNINTGTFSLYGIRYS